MTSKVFPVCESNNESDLEVIVKEHVTHSSLESYTI